MQPLYPGIELNLRDRVAGEVEKYSFIALPGKGGPQRANALKPVCPHLEEVVRSFIVIIQRGRDHVDLLLIGWW